mmetsp:Transcript_42934/g.48763  ORF Transcript_42934/g.48763 Transcript_42934/m.48763 type:complete len:386 (+) Transcript_42934:347-1504(+)
MMKKVSSSKEEKRSSSSIVVPTTSTTTSTGTTTKYYDYNHSMVSLQQGMILLVSYVLLGILAYSYIFENWSITTSIYFSVVTFTTIGYGDITPTTDGGKLFCCFYSLFGVCMVGGLVLNIIGLRLLAAQERTMQEVRKRSVQRVTNMFTPILLNNKEKEGSLRPSLPPGHVLLVEDEDNNNNDTNYIKIIMKLMMGIVLISIVSHYFIFEQQHDDYGLNRSSIINTMYFTICTITTIGYGDISPPTKESIITILFLPLIVAFMGEVMGQISSFYISQMEKQLEDEFLRRELTFADLEQMDCNQDGYVTTFEFVTFMLCAMNKVDSKNDIDRLVSLFQNELCCATSEENRHKLTKEELVLRMKQRHEQLSVLSNNNNNSSITKKNE